jgi:hypothetical protein
MQDDMRRFVRKDASSEPRELQGGAGGGDLWEEIVAAECGVGAVVRSRELLDGKRCQYLYFCTSKASKLQSKLSARPPRKRCQYLYFCTSKASKLSARPPRKRCQYLYFCTSKASKLPVSAQEVGVSSGRPVKALLWLY